MAPGQRAGSEIEVGSQHIGSGDFIFEAIEAAGRANRLRRAFAQDDATRINQMDAPIDEVAVAGRFFETPVLVADLRAVRDFRRRAAPGVPVKRSGWGLWRG